MTSIDHRPTATIHPFPKRGRFADRREQAEQAAIAEIRTYAACDSWYHEEALRESDPTRVPS